MEVAAVTLRSLPFFISRDQAGDAKVIFSVKYLKHSRAFWPGKENIVLNIELITFIS